MYIFCYHDKFIILESTKIFVCTYFDESVHWVTVHTRIIESLITCEIFVSTFRVCHVLLSRVRKYHVLVWLSVGQYVRAYKCDLVLQSSKLHPKVCFSKRVFLFYHPKRKDREKNRSQNEPKLGRRKTKERPTSLSEALFSSKTLRKRKYDAKRNESQAS